ncbi:hypothetical protein CES85_1242 [Ochrobactrum quorumnocens]|uniref:Uncharacterized protein n=1 Tax=Ochrobactrum quorumnocens TaxID=271865 RepID=A0A248UIJ4_9HYPH|nr:hypothetical protein CES85_1242 [[Ochrobactrum] quorumnocens]
MGEDYDIAQRQHGIQPVFAIRWGLLFNTRHYSVLSQVIRPDCHKLWPLSLRGSPQPVRRSIIGVSNS